MSEHASEAESSDDSGHGGPVRRYALAALGLALVAAAAGLGTVVGSWAPPDPPPPVAAPSTSQPAGPAAPPTWPVRQHSSYPTSVAGPSPRPLPQPRQREAPR